MRINKSGMIEMIALRLDITFSEAERIVNTVSSVIYETLHDGDSLNWHGLGHFSVFTAKETMRRSPSTHKMVKIPSHKRPKFLPGEQLKSCIKK